MLNFYTLESREFGELSRDVLQKITGVELELTDMPHDQGVDMTDDRIHPAIVGQAKHYISSTIPQLLASLGKEKERLERLRPERYYLFLSKDLTQTRIMEIIELFSPVVELGQKNIFTLKRLDDLLQSKEYREILKRHPKLWNFSVDILNEVLHRDIDFDTREMLCEMQQCGEFVPTTSYSQCLDTLEEQHLVLLQGAPGSGKTITSKMVALDYARRGYRVHYTTDGDISRLKGVLSGEEVDELILLDDFLGQLYFTLDRHRSEELRTLLSYIRRSEHKRMILNSRITVLQEARVGNVSFAKLLCNVPVVEMDSLTRYEKARILHSHLQKNCTLRDDILRYIAQADRYMSVIQHENFNPRLVEMMEILLSRNPSAEEFYRQLKEMLDDPQNIWREEFEKNLRPEDRVLLTTLYSLTNSEVSYEILEACYHARILRMPEIDGTVNQFALSLNRLNQSMVRTSLGEERKIEALNPSVNDFLRGYLERNPLERAAIAQAALFYEQIDKVMSIRNVNILDNPPFLDLLRRKLEDHSILDLTFKDRFRLGNILLYHCTAEGLRLDRRYWDEMIEIIRSGYISYIDPFRLQEETTYIAQLFSEPLWTFLGTDRLLEDPAFLNGLINSVSSEGISSESQRLFPVLQLIWDALIQPVTTCEYDVAAFQKMATEAAEYALLRETMGIGDFAHKAYDTADFEAKAKWFDEDMHIDDIISYFEGDLKYDLEEDLTEEYVRYVTGYLEDALYDRDWFTGSLSVDGDTIMIDQDVWEVVDQMVDAKMSDALPEKAYDEYAGWNREASANMDLERRFAWGGGNDLENSREEAEIRALFSGENHR